MIAHPHVKMRRARRGAGTLVLAQLLLFTASMGVLSVNRSVLFEQCTSANQMQSSQALEVAEAVKVTAWACNAQAATCSHTNFNQSDGNARISAILKLRPMLRDMPSAPLTCGTSCIVGGSFDVIKRNVSTNGILINAGTTISTAPGTTAVTLQGLPTQAAMVGNDVSLAALSGSDPIALVMPNAIRVNGNNTFYGLTFSNSADWNDIGTGTAVIYGAGHLRGLQHQRQRHDQLRPRHLEERVPADRPAGARARQPARLQDRCGCPAMTTTVRPPSRGFSLLESLAALLIVAFGLLGLGSLNVRLANNQDTARLRGEATRLAEEKVEQLRSYTRLSSSAGRLAWTDRAGETQSVSFGSVISQTDPTDVGALGFPLPENATLRRPKNRNLNITVPAVDLGNGQSVSQVQSNVAVALSNASGYVVLTCNFIVHNASELPGCTEAAAYIVAGDVSRRGRSSFLSGLGADTSALTGTAGTTCSLSDAMDPNGGGPIAGYKYYLCVISVPHAGDPWSGTLRLAAHALHEGPGNYLVCRFQFPSAGGVSANARNVQPYSGVTESLDNQNLVISTANSCPTIDSLATTPHQNCRSSNPNANGNRGSDCPEN